MCRMKTALSEALLVTTLAALALSACASGPPLGLHFARTSARIIQPVDYSYGVNFIFVADSAHKIFREYDGITIDSVGTIDNVDAPLTRGETRRGQTLANIEPEIPLRAAPFEFSNITVHFKDGTSQLFDVGVWSFEPLGAARIQPKVASWPAAIPECARLDLELLDYPTGASQAALQIGQEGVSLGDGSKIEAGPGRRAKLVLEIECNAEFDFFIIGATVETDTANGRPATLSLEPIMVGQIDISDEDVARISSR